MSLWTRWRLGRARGAGAPADTAAEGRSPRLDADDCWREVEATYQRLATEAAALWAAWQDREEAAGGLDAALAQADLAEWRAEEAGGRRREALSRRGDLQHLYEAALRGAPDEETVCLWEGALAEVRQEAGATQLRLHALEAEPHGKAAEARAAVHQAQARHRRAHHQVERLSAQLAALEHSLAEARLRWHQAEGAARMDVTPERLQRLGDAVGRLLGEVEKSATQVGQRAAHLRREAATLRRREARAGARVVAARRRWEARQAELGRRTAALVAAWGRHLSGTSGATYTLPAFGAEVAITVSSEAEVSAAARALREPPLRQQLQRCAALREEECPAREAELRQRAMEAQALGWRAVHLETAAEEAQRLAGLLCGRRQSLQEDARLLEQLLSACRRELSACAAAVAELRLQLEDQQRRLREDLATMGAELTQAERTIAEFALPEDLLARLQTQVAYHGNRGTPTQEGMRSLVEVATQWQREGAEAGAAPRSQLAPLSPLTEPFLLELVKAERATVHGYEAVRARYRAQSEALEAALRACRGDDDRGGYLAEVCRFAAESAAAPLRMTSRLTELTAIVEALDRTQACAEALRRRLQLVTALQELAAQDVSTLTAPFFAWLRKVITTAQEAAGELAALESAEDVAAAFSRLQAAESALSPLIPVWEACASFWAPGCIPSFDRRQALGQALGEGTHQIPGFEPFLRVYADLVTTVSRVVGRMDETTARRWLGAGLPQEGVLRHATAEEAAAVERAYRLRGLLEELCRPEPGREPRSLAATLPWTARMRRGAPRGGKPAG